MLKEGQKVKYRDTIYIIDSIGPRSVIIRPTINGYCISLPKYLLEFHCPRLNALYAPEKEKFKKEREARMQQMQRLLDAAFTRLSIP